MRISVAKWHSPPISFHPKSNTFPPSFHHHNNHTHKVNKNHLPPTTHKTHSQSTKTTRNNHNASNLHHPTRPPSHHPSLQLLHPHHRLPQPAVSHPRGAWGYGRKGAVGVGVRAAIVDGKGGGTPDLLSIFFSCSYVRKHQIAS